MRRNEEKEEEAEEAEEAEEEEDEDEEVPGEGARSNTGEGN